MSVDYSKIENVVLNRTEEAFVMQNLANLLDVIGADYRLTPSERQSLASINHANKGFVQDALEAIRIFEDMLPGYIDGASMETTWEYYIQLERAALQAERLVEVIRDRRQTAGSILYRDALVVYNVMKAGSRHAIGGFEALVKRMKSRFLGQGPTSVAMPEASESEAAIVAFAPHDAVGSNNTLSGGEAGDSMSLAA